jgi:indolepyruvate ferredoxin oxidoreductase
MARPQESAAFTISQVPHPLVEVSTNYSISLDDRWSERAPSALRSGVQAIVRALLDQRREDREHQIASGGFASGYPGSPLGGLDKELQRRGDDLAELGIVFAPGLNEELAATSAWGAQLAHLQRGAQVEGVLSMWFGKSPGLDRASDALRHANISGVGPASGAIAVVGDDPACKSSTLPSSSERTLAGLLMPVLAPASVQDVLDLTRHGLRLSRAAGLWCAVKLDADVADASMAVIHRGGLAPVQRLVDHVPSAHLLGAPSVELERSLVELRLPAAVRYAREHELNRTVISGPRDEVGLIAGGLAYAELRRALHELGLHERELNEFGVRILKIGMPWPLDDDAIRRFADGLHTVLVIEEKLPHLESEVKAALHGLSGAPRVIGKRDQAGAPLLAAHGSLGAEQISLALGVLLDGRLGGETQAARRLNRLALAKAPAPPPIARAPFFCSGCPHSSSTAAAPDTLVGAGIGCHVMLVQDAAGGARPSRSGEVIGLTQMGGEGSQWIGISPFISTEHFTQNLGDGTFHHSGSLALRAAIAAKVNITYKLLYNDAVAMTGGQPVEGMMSVPRLTRMLKAEGVARIAVTTDQPRRYRRARLAAGTKVYDRSRLSDLEGELASVRGVSVIIHDQMCAAERRRLRRRGKLQPPAERPWINQRVCEGCGDCGQASGCLSVEPVQTELGRKTRIHQSSCNIDMSCLRGDCPSFLTVRPGKRERVRREPPAELPEPALSSSCATIRMVGIGGTGVVTVAQVLAMAAHLEGRPVSLLDQTGLSQKGGPVVSDLRIGEPVAGEAAPRASSQTADVLVGFDLLGAADPRFGAASDPCKTVAVISSSAIPTGESVMRADAPIPDPRDLQARIESRCASMPVLADARLIAERAFGEDQQANMVLLGAAWQLGVIPVGWEALARAVELNAAAVAENLTALRWGRAIVADPQAVRELIGEDEELRGADEVTLRAVRGRDLPPDLHAMLAQRAQDLSDYGGRALAQRYLDELRRIALIESERAGAGHELTESVARQLHKLLAYKDEYEVARLHLLPAERERRERELGRGAQTWVHLHPPLLRAIGLSRKIRLGRSARPLFHVLRAGRRLRGTPFDPFGYASVRKVERALPGEYLAMITQALELLDERTRPQVVAVSEQAQRIRGYEQIKLRNVEAWRSSCAALMDQLRGMRRV